MTDLQSTLDAIDRALADYDANTLPPLPGPDATAAVEVAHALGFDVPRCQADVVTTSFGPPPEQDPTRGWLLRWFRRHR